MCRFIAVFMLCASMAMAQSPLQIQWWRGTTSFSVTGGLIDYGNAVDLNGTSEYFADTNATLTSGMQSFTVAAWIKLQDLGGTLPRGILSHRSVGGGEILAFDYIPTNNSVRTVCWIGATAGTGYYVFGYTLSNAFTTATWYHVAATCITGSAPIIYLNGVTNYSSRFLDGLRTDAKDQGGIRQTTPFSLGYDPRDSFDANYLFNGVIDEAIIYKDRILDAGEIAELATGIPITTGGVFTASGIPMSNGLVRVWHLDEWGYGGIARDHAQNTYAIGANIDADDWKTGIVSPSFLRPVPEQPAGITNNLKLIYHLDQEWTNVVGVSTGIPGGNRFAYYQTNAVMPKSQVMGSRSLYAWTNAYLDTGNSEGGVSSNLFNSGSQMTVSAWIKMTEFNPYAGIVFSRGTYTAADGGYWRCFGLYTISNVVSRGYKVRFAGARDGNGVNTFCYLRTNQWYNLLGTCNTNGQVRLYVNGELVDSTNSPTRIAMEQDDFIRIGRDDYGDTYGFKGQIDEVAAWNRVLSSNEAYYIGTSTNTIWSP